MRNSFIILMVFMLCLGVGQLSAQVSFFLRNDLLQDQDVHSAVPVGITDMNGDGLDDIVGLNLGRRLIVQYQTPDPARPFVRYTSEIVIDNNEQNDIIIGDFNNDGWNDMVITGTYDRMKILYAVPFTYDFNLVYITASAFFSQGASAGDFNHDGWLDAVILNDNGLNYTLMNDGTGTLRWQDYFDFVTVPPSDNSGNYGCVYTDFDMDGDLDFYIAKCRQGVNDPADPRRINALFVNDGSGQYAENAARYGLASGRQSWTADFGDIDNDGDLDCFITQHDVVSELFENIDNDTFVNITSSAGLNIGGVPLQGMFVDLDNDGFMDILVSGDRFECFRNNGNKTFTRVEPFGGKVYGSFGLGDLNHDGFVDIYASTVIPYNNPDPLRADALFLNGGNDHHFLSVTLRDSTGNRSVVGAMAMLYGTWGVQLREVRAGEQYGVSNSHTLLFGLGNAATWDSLVIRWPDGIRERFDLPAADNHYFLSRPGCWTTYANPLPSLEVLCGQDSLKLFLDQNVAGIQWSNGATSDTITVGDPGLYYAVYDDNGCFSRTYPTEVIKNPDTAAPKILVDNALERCASDTATLSLPLARGYLWSTGDTTQRIRVNATGAYSAIVQGYCLALPSDTINLTFVTPALPFITTDTVAPGETARLTATGDSILWFADDAGLAQIGAGDTLYLPGLLETRAVWARNIITLKGEEGYVGQGGHAGNTKYNGAGTNAGLVFEVYKEMVIEAFSVFTDSAGLRWIEIIGDNGFFYAYPADLTPGENRLRLEVRIPPGAYAISTNTDQNLMTFGVNSPILWRSSAGVTYPYAFGDVMAITNSTLNAINFYYYFYHWEVREVDRECPSALAKAEVMVDTETALPDIDLSGQLVVLPNPARDWLTVANLPADARSLEIIGIGGDLLYRREISGARQMEVCLGQFTPGLYWVRVWGGQSVAVAKFTHL